MYNHVPVVPYYYIIQSHCQNICGYLIFINITYNFEYFNHFPPGASIYAKVGRPNFCNLSG